jgi:imidazolonepropionase-like amidohydrolase
MSIWSKLRGTSEAFWQLGLGGPQLKANASAIENRNAADAAFVVARALDPIASNDLVTLAYLIAHTIAGGFTSVAAGATQTVTVGGLYAADPTGARVTFNFPSSPVDGAITGVKLIGASVANPVAYVAGAGDTIEDPETPGTFSAVAGTVAQSVPGAWDLYKYDRPNTRWIHIS